MIYTATASKFLFYDNQHSRKTMQQIKAETGCDVIFNGTLFDFSTLTPCCDVKIGGVLKSNDPYTYYGYGWNNGGLPAKRHSDDMSALDNFLSCIWAVDGGEAQTLYYNADVGGVRPRTAFGFKKSGDFVFCSVNATPENTRTALINAGCDTGIILDGGGSTQYMTPAGSAYSQRIVSNLLCVWVKKNSGDDHMNIIQPNYVWNGTPVKRSKTTMVVFHHAAGYGSPEEIHAYHKALGWKGIAYNFYVRMDGTIYFGRPVGTVGGHTLNYNSVSIGVCAEGNFEVDTMSAAQRDALKWLHDVYIPRYYQGLADHRHSDLNSTACPGKNYPYEYITQGGETPDHEPEIGGIAAFQSWLGGGLTVDGIYGPKTKTAALKAYQTALNALYGAGLAVDGIWGAKTRAATRSVSRGEKSDVVKILQGMLYCFRFDPQGLDGAFGANTYSQVAAFQNSVHLTADGIAGKQTWTALFN